MFRRFWLHHPRARRLIIGAGLAGLLFSGWQLAHQKRALEQTSVVHQKTSPQQKKPLSASQRAARTRRLRETFLAFQREVRAAEDLQKNEIVHYEEGLPFIIESYQRIIDSYEGLFEDIDYLEEIYDELVADDALQTQLRADYDAGKISEEDWQQQMKEYMADKVYLGDEQIAMLGAVAEQLRYIVDIKERATDAAERLLALNEDDDDELAAMQQAYAKMSHALQQLYDDSSAYHLEMLVATTPAGL